MKHGPITDKKADLWRERAKHLNTHTEHRPYEVQLLLADIYGALCETPWWRFIVGGEAINLAETIQRDHHECCGTEDPDD